MAVHGDARVITADTTTWRHRITRGVRGDAVLEELGILGRMSVTARARRLRTMRQFAEGEIAIVDGPFKGRRFRCDRQPFTGLWFDAVDSGRFTRFVATGPSQSGKSLAAYVIPILYHLFEHGETVVAGVPEMKMAYDKWNKSIRPVLERTRYAELTPRIGKGSKGGEFDSITFRNGATLKFMSGGGLDKARAGFTTRIVVITEGDGFAVSASSVEADKITQIEARQRAFPRARRRTYMECTLSVKEGRTYQEISKGTDSKILTPCPHCRAYMAPERCNLSGWQDADNEHAAEAASAFQCPACGAEITEHQRRVANAAAVLVHKGQEIVERAEAGEPVEDGKPLQAGGPVVVGAPPATETLGMRWSAFHNLFVSAGDVGVDEWHAERAHDEDNAEREMCQFVWAVPYAPPVVEIAPLDAAVLTRRVGPLPRGIVPDWAVYLTVGVDLGRRVAHYVVIAWGEDFTGQVIDYGRFDVASDDMQTEKAILIALRDFRDICGAGWGLAAGGVRQPDCVFIDAGWQGEQAGIHPVYAFVRESGKPYWAVLGRGGGAGQFRGGSYRQPTKKTAEVVSIGYEYYMRLNRAERIHIFEINADAWKTRLHDSLAAAEGSPGALSLFAAPPKEHTSFVKHLTAEHKIEEFVPGKGTIVRWVRDRRSNHWLDGANYAGVAAHACGARLIQQEGAKKEIRETASRAPALMTPGGQAFLATER